MLKSFYYKSGIRLIMEKIEGSRSLSLGIWVNTGSSQEESRDFGISHYIEHMLFKGTENRTAFEIVNEIDMIGGQQNAFTGKEKTCYFIKVLDEHFKIAADVLVDMICNPLCDLTEMEREKLVICEEIKMNADDPDDVAIDNLENIVYKNTPMAHPVLGSRESVMSFTRESVLDYYKSHYTKDNIVISVAGSFNEDEIIDYFENAFDKLGSKSLPKKEYKLPSSKEVSGYNEIHKDIEQSHLALGIKGIVANDDKKTPLRILNTILGGGMSSRLFQNIREKKGLAYSIHSSLGFNKKSGLFLIEAGVSNENVEKTLMSIKEELDNIHKYKISDSEINSAKEQIKSTYIFSSENVQSRMILNGLTILNEESILTQDEMLREIDSIKSEDIERVKYIIDDYDNYSIINVCS